MAAPVRYYVDHNGQRYERRERRYWKVSHIPQGETYRELSPLQDYMYELEDGAFVRTHGCVSVVACPHCGAKAGERCIGDMGPRCGTHYVRRDAYREGLRVSAASRARRARA